MKPQLVEVWMCSKCERTYDDKKEARKCCLCVNADCNVIITGSNTFCERHGLLWEIKHYQDLESSAKKAVAKTRADYKAFMERRTLRKRK